MRKQHKYILQSIAIATVILLISLVVNVFPVYAQTLPSDTKTIQIEVQGTANTVLVNTTTAKTILGVAIQQQNIASDTDLRCGTTVLARNYATNFSYVPINYICFSTINIQKTGNDKASVVVNYVERDTSTTLDPLSDLTATVVSTSTSPLFVQDAGNLSFLLTILISLMFLMVVGFVYNNMTNKKPWH